MAGRWAAAGRSARGRRACWTRRSAAAGCPQVHADRRRRAAARGGARRRRHRLQPQRPAPDAGPARPAGPASPSQQPPPDGPPRAACPPGAPKAARCAQTVECFDADAEGGGCAGAHTLGGVRLWRPACGQPGEGRQGQPDGRRGVQPEDAAVGVPTGGDAGASTCCCRSLAAQKAGPTVFRCLAGNPPSTFTGQQLAPSVGLLLAQQVLGDEVEDHLAADRRDPAGAGRRRAASPTPYSVVMPLPPWVWIAVSTASADGLRRRVLRHVRGDAGLQVAPAS